MQWQTRSWPLGLNNPALLTADPHSLSMGSLQTRQAHLQSQAGFDTSRLSLAALQPSKLTACCRTGLSAEDSKGFPLSLDPLACFTADSLMPALPAELSVDTASEALQAGAEAADEYMLPLEQFEAREARKLPLELPAAFLSGGSSQPPQQPEDDDTQEGWASSLKSLVQQVVPFKSDFAAGGRKMGLRSGARRTRLQEVRAHCTCLYASQRGL